MIKKDGRGIKRTDVRERTQWIKWKEENEGEMEGREGGIVKKKLKRRDGRNERREIIGEIERRKKR